ncbi:hypothetical protein [Hoyosella altamirensis]|uniref:Uncharacterized protein n=1 Tax=Hoyosella altamirensis TaxID=616997 RepID=A0A839RTG4_9ACTN|nr:hypothetical protein [Hoyosella altamirensis]MBB3039649.1 hypothetical protein [Hoyosella altamirensis]
MGSGITVGLDAAIEVRARLARAASAAADAALLSRHAELLQSGEAAIDRACAELRNWTEAYAVTRSQFAVSIPAAMDSLTHQEQDNARYLRTVALSHGLEL